MPKAATARRIPAAGINLFQLIYVLLREYQERTGRPPMNLSLGNPDGVPNERLRALQAKYAADPGFEYHTYAEDGDLKGFAEAMVELHGRIRVSEHPGLRAVPIPGIKTAGALMPLACGLHLPDAGRRRSFRIASCLPAYDIIGTWGGSYLGAERIAWPLDPRENMKPSLERLERALRDAGAERPDLVYVIRPGNPAAVAADAEEWRRLGRWCAERGARLVNDAAYAGLAGEHHVPLAQVAPELPGLEWLELYSVSKSFNDPGARLGALVGSKDFVEDFLLIKGNTESGPVPSVMAAYGEYFQDPVRAREDLAELRDLYDRRVAYVSDRLKQAGLRPACGTDAGFFTLWKVPRRVLGIELASDPRTRDLPAHEAFNRHVIHETGLVGVHFSAPDAGGGAVPLIRYAVCSDVLAPAFQDRFERELARLRPEY